MINMFHPSRRIMAGMTWHVLYAQVLEQAWPFFGMYMEKLLKEKIEPAVRLSNSALKTFKFTKVHFGHIVSLYPFTFHYS